MALGGVDLGGPASCSQQGCGTRGQLSVPLQLAAGQGASRGYQPPPTEWSVAPAAVAPRLRQRARSPHWEALPQSSGRLLQNPERPCPRGTAAGKVRGEGQGGKAAASGGGGDRRRHLAPIFAPAAIAGPSGASVLTLLRARLAPCAAAEVVAHSNAALLLRAGPALPLTAACLANCATAWASRLRAAAIHPGVATGGAWCGGGEGRSAAAIAHLVRSRGAFALPRHLPHAAPRVPQLA